MKISILAVLLLVILGAAGYWLEKTGFIPASWTEMASLGQSAPGQQHPPARTQQGNRGPMPVEVAAARPARLSDDISAIGTLLADESADIAAETSGRIAEVLFKDGQTVETGAALFKLDADLINAELADDQAKLSLAQANFNRNQTLRKSGNVAQSAYEASATELNLARSAAELAKVKLDKLTIKAPFPGMLGFRSISVGAYVVAGTPLVHLDKIDRLKVSFSAPELDLNRLATGQEVEVTADALPGETFTARISAIDPVVDVNGRALKIRADLDNAAGRLKPGLLVRIIVKGPLRDAVTVPEAAIVPRGNDSIVYVAADNKAREAKVKTGKRSEGAVEIVEGIDAGAQVVVAGNTRLTNGATIEIVGSQAATN